MFHDCRQRDVERLGQRTDGKVWLLGKPRQHRAARRIGERGEGAVERHDTMLNHVVKYRSAAAAVKPRQSGPAIAALTSLMPSALDHSAGPAISPISQPARSTISVVGMPKALPASFKSWKTLALGSE